MNDYGLQVFNSSGKIILDISDRIGRFLGSFSPGGAVSGNINDSRLTSGIPFYIVIPGRGYSNVPCYVSFSGSSLSWYYDKSKYPDLSSYGDYTTGVISPSDMVYYGVY